jgi:hypothetical protein
MGSNIHKIFGLKRGIICTIKRIIAAITLNDNMVVSNILDLRGFLSSG